MATSSGASIKQMLQDRRVQIALALFALLAVAAILFLTGVFGGGTSTTAVDEGIAGPGGYPGAYPGGSSAGSGGYPGGMGGYPGGMAGYPGGMGGYPGGMGGYPGASGGYPGAGIGAGSSPLATSAAGSKKMRTSFDRPQGVGAGLATNPADPFGGAGAAGGTGVTGPKPLPIVEGKRALAARVDPFFSVTKSRPPEPPPAYLFTVPMRLAAFRPPPAQIVAGLEVRPPLPYVPRRVAGILTDGTTSAILETGNPGADAQVDLVQPGSHVDSGIPGVPQLVVESITPTQLTLRAPDGRRVTVKLSALPPGALGGGGFDGGGYPGGGGGYPGGVGGPGGGAPPPVGGAPID